MVNKTSIFWRSQCKELGGWQGRWCGVPLKWRTHKKSSEEWAQMPSAWEALLPMVSWISEAWAWEKARWPLRGEKKPLFCVAHWFGLRPTDQMAVTLTRTARPAWLAYLKILLWVMNSDLPVSSLTFLLHLRLFLGSILLVLPWCKYPIWYLKQGSEVPWMDESIHFSFYTKEWALITHSEIRGLVTRVWRFVLLWTETFKSSFSMTSAPLS